MTQTNIANRSKEIYTRSLFFTVKRLENPLKCGVCPQNRRKMVGTKHCCWGECKTDSRYRERWAKSLKEVEESGKKVFIPFPKPSQDIEKVDSSVFVAGLHRKEYNHKHVHICPSLAWRKGTNRRISRSAESEFYSSTNEPRVDEKESACIKSEAGSNSRKKRKNSGCMDTIQARN